MNNENIDFETKVFLFAMLVISIGGWRYGWLGIQKYNPLSEVPLILYLIIHVFKNKMIRLEKSFIFEIVLVIIMLIYSVIIANIKNYNTRELINGINLFAFYYLTYLPIHFFLNGVTPAVFDKMLICIKKSFNFALVAGIIQSFNIYIYRFAWYERFILLFTENINDIDRRIRFTFSEPSTSCSFIIFLYIPVCIMLKKRGYIFKTIDKVQFLLLIFETVLTVSISVYIAVMILLISVCIVYKRRRKSILLLGIGIATYILLLIIGTVNGELIDARVFDLLINPIDLFFKDDSIKTRICMFYVAIAGIRMNPILGSGWNFFIEAMRSANSYIPYSLITEEYIYNITHWTIYVSYEALFCSVACGGGIGVIWLLHILRTRFKANVMKSLKPFKISFCCCLFIGIGFMRIIPVIMFMELCSNKNIISILEKE